MKVQKHIGVIALLAVFGASMVQAQIKGTIITKDDRRMTGNLRWKNREKAYAIEANNVSVDLPLANVKQLDIPKPAGLDAAVKNVKDGNAAAAIPVLEKVVSDYTMLTWDSVATRYLAQAHLKAGDAEKALRVCERVTNTNPDQAFIGEMAPTYWQALLKLGRTSRVEDLMARAIRSGDRIASGAALIMRGDVVLAAGDNAESAKKALLDGYLRVVLLYTNEKELQPEALYKAAKCFEKMGQSARADAMRSQLKKGFPQSEWAKM